MIFSRGASSARDTNVRDAGSGSRVDPEPAVIELSPKPILDFAVDVIAVRTVAGVQVFFERNHTGILPLIGFEDLLTHGRIDLGMTSTISSSRAFNSMACSRLRRRGGTRRMASSAVGCEKHVRQLL